MNKKQYKTALNELYTFTCNECKKILLWAKYCEYQPCDNNNTCYICNQKGGTQ